MTISRRQFMTTVLGGTAGAVLLSAAGCGGPSAGQTAVLLRSKTKLPPRFAVPLPIPPVKQPTAVVGGVQHYDIAQHTTSIEILPGMQTEIMGYDGIFPGPTIESRSGQPIAVNHTNNFTMPTVVHLHGGHTAAASDGYPIDFVLPQSGGDMFMHHGMVGDVSQGSRQYDYSLDQRASTLWYHDHRMDFTAQSVYRGLAGFHIVRDDVEDALPLPDGDREILLMITDRAFGADGAFRYPAKDPAMMHTPGTTAAYMSGVLGDVVLVNGAPWPQLEVEAARYRLRFLNASNARRYGLALSPKPSKGKSFVQIGSDGGLLSAPVKHDEIQIAAAERFDVIVDFSAYKVGTDVTLTNTLGTGSTDAVMRFKVTKSATDDSSVPDKLSDVEPLEPGPNAVHREWKFTRGVVNDHAGWTINDKAFDPGRMDARPKLGEVEVWRFYSDLHHPIHVHLSPFQVLSRGNGNPGEYDVGWKDTIDLRPAEFAEVAIKFTTYTGKYLLHCHNLEHEDMAMMAAFETV